MRCTHSPHPWGRALAILFSGALAAACDAALPTDTGGEAAEPMARGGGRSAARAARPEITAVRVGSNGFVSSTDVMVVVDAKGPAPLAAVCLSTSPACPGWQALADAYPLRLRRGAAPQIIRAWVRDADGVISPVARATVQVDGRPPVDGTLTATPAPGGVELRWTGFRDDGAGIAHFIVRGAAGSIVPYCSGRAALEATPAADATSATFSGLGPGTWSFSVCAVDAFGRQSAGATVRTTAGADPDAPTITTFSVQGGAAWTATRAVQLELAASDPGGVDAMCITEAASCTAWQPYTPAPMHTLSGGGGEKRLQAWVRDAWGNVSAPAALTVGFDTDPPRAGALTLSALPGGAQLSWGGFADDQSGVGAYTLSRALDRAPSTCASGEVIYEGNLHSITDLGLISGQRYGYRLCAADAVGNTHSGVTGNVTPLAELDPPTLTSVLLAGGAPAVSDRYVSLELAAADASGVARMCVSNTPACGTWRTFVASSMWTLEAGAAGDRTVYVWLEDSLGNQSATPTSATVRFAPDRDRDGFAEGWDCDDEDPLVFPGAATTCSSEDRDCDGAADDDADSDGLRAEACGGWDCDDADSAANASTCPQGLDCLDVLEAGRSTGDGVYRVDPDGWGEGEPTSTVRCEMDAHGGGWTLLATNPSSLARELMIDTTTFGAVSLTTRYRGLPWFNQPFTDLMFEDGTTFAVYEDVGDGTESWFEFQSHIPAPDCTPISGLSWPMTAGNLTGARLCSTDLYVNPHDQDGGRLCDTTRLYSDFALGPTWSVTNNNICPLDDPAGSSFANKGTATSFRGALRMWAR